MQKLRTDPDSLQFADQDLLRYIQENPAEAMIHIDRIKVKQGGLRAFIELAWDCVEKPGKFRGNWHIDAICSELEAVVRGETTRLAIAQPPRSMKSLICSVFFPAWVWIEHPETRFLYASYAMNLSVRDSVKCRRVLQSKWYQDRWGDKFALQGDQNAKTYFENNKSGYRLATSVDGQGTGQGGDIIVIDDANNVKETESEATREGTLRWWDETMPSRLNDPDTGAFIIIQQRVHARDLFGHATVDPEEKYKICCLPMLFEKDHPNKYPNDPRQIDGELLWPDRIPQHAVDSLKRRLGSYAFAAQLQQRPTAREGGLFKRHWFSKIKALPNDCQFSRAWDLAATVAKTTKSDPDYSATVKVAWSPSMQKFIVAHVDRFREDAGTVRKNIKMWAEHDGVSIKQTVPQDPGQAGKDQAQQLALLLAGWPVQIEPQTGDKVTRAYPFAGQSEVGNVVLLEAKWNDEYLEEMCAFPMGDHDDMVDATASAFNRISGGSTGILDYYSDLAEVSKANADKHIDARNGMVVVERETTDWAQALYPNAVREHRMGLNK